MPKQTPTPAPKDDDVERVDTEEVKLNVVAFDENGDFFPGVKETDLVITENDILHQPSSVRRIPANVLIILDTGGEMRQVKSLDQTKRIARAVVSSLKPDDAIAIMEYSDSAVITSDLTTDREATAQAIAKTKFGRLSAFAEALDLAADYLQKNPLENKHIVLITDGTDSRRDQSAKRDAIQRLLTTEISVHVLSYTRMEVADIAPRTKGISNTPPPKAMPDEVAATLPNGVRDNATAQRSKTINLDRTLLQKLKTRKTDLELSEKQLESLAENTNGTSVIPETLDEMVDKTAFIAKLIDASYAVTYIPKVPIASGGKIGERKIEVTSKRPGLQVIARRRLFIDRRR
ncbi:MAG TPA: VWA domain-containing protein [Pyrinomonadaceae bacterium]|nr:VWA domain-containing protein [Pyrinomonadaceae bacterium]